MLLKETLSLALHESKEQVLTNQSEALIESDKKILPTFLLCFLFGIFGLHRFYVGKIGTGILHLLTLGCLGLWTLVDLIVIIVGAFKDKSGRKLKSWT